MRPLSSCLRGSPVCVPAGLTVGPFSFTLLLDAGDIGPEVGRLFGTALLFILVVLVLVLVLVLVYLLRPERGGRRRMVRRTAVDVGLGVDFGIHLVGSPPRGAPTAADPPAQGGGGHVPVTAAAIDVMTPACCACADGR